MTTVAQQSETFIAGLRTRRRDPVKPATLAAYGSYLNKWIVPTIGHLDLAVVENGTMRRFVSELVECNLRASTINGITTTLKLLISSDCDENGNERYPRKWNADFIDAPRIIPTAQDAPVISATAVSTAIRGASGQFRTLYALLAGTGLRISEALGLKVLSDPDEPVSGWFPGNMTIYVRSALYRGENQGTKTPAGVREVDLNSQLNAYLTAHVKGVLGQLLFQSRTGSPVHLNTAYRHAIADGIPGYHSFRRFRITHLEGVGCPHALTQFWVGHAAQGVTGRYTRLGEDFGTRKKWCERAGLGFELTKEA